MNRKIIWVVVSCLLSFPSFTQEPGTKSFKLSREEKKEGFKVLFDGTSLDHWYHPEETDYMLEDGCIVMHPTPEGGDNLYTKEKFRNFIFRFEFRLTPAANNGLGLRHKIVPHPGSYDGMELQIIDSEAPVYKDLKPYQYHGSVYGLIPAKRGYLKPAGEWNEQKVIADGDHITVILNEQVILDGNLSEAAKSDPGNKVPESVFYKEGHIAFLGHGDTVSFRNIRIKEL